jgi:hypothetical protein
VFAAAEILVEPPLAFGRDSIERREVRLADAVRLLVVAAAELAAATASLMFGAFLPALAAM